MYGNELSWAHLKKAGPTEACIVSHATARSDPCLVNAAEDDAELANDEIASAYWLFQDWGAFGKALVLSQKYDFLTVSEESLLVVQLSLSFSGTQ